MFKKGDEICEKEGTHKLIITVLFEEKRHLYKGSLGMSSNL
jgi:hypothetical protein